MSGARGAVLEGAVELVSRGGAARLAGDRVSQSWLVCQVAV